MLFRSIIKNFHMNEFKDWDRATHFDWMAETIHRELSGQGPILVTIKELSAEGELTRVVEAGRNLTVKTAKGEEIRLRITSDTNIEGAADRTRLALGMKARVLYKEPEDFNPALGYDVIELEVVPR